MEREMFDTPSVSMGGPPVRQYQSNIQCLAVIARRHGLNWDVSRIVEENALPDGPVSTRTLMRCARKAGLKAKVLKLARCDLRSLGRLKSSIVTLETGASMILVGYAASNREGKNLDAPFVVLEDPTVGENDPLTLDRIRFEETCTGEVIKIWRDYDITDEEQPFGIGLLKSLLYRERRLLRDLVICAAILSFIAIAPIMFYRLLSDRVLANLTNKSSTNTFVVLCLGMGAIIVCETIFSYFRNYFVTTVTTRVDIRMHEYIYERVLKLPIDYFERTPAGKISHDVNDAEKIHAFLTDLLGPVLDSMTLLVFLPVMFLFSPLMTAAVVAFCTLIVLWFILMLPANRRAAGVRIEAETARGTFLYQTLQGMRTVKSLALETRQRREWGFLVAGVVKATLLQGFVMSVVHAGQRPLERLAVSGTLLLGAYIAISRNDPVFIGALFAFFMLSQRVAGPLVAAAGLVNKLDEARAAVVIVGALVNQPKEESQGYRGVKTPLSGHVQFFDLRFKYKGSTNYALDDLSFEVPIGHTLGVVGRSGSGKTTITRLLQRLHTEYEGSIEIDGVDVRKYDLAHLRRSLGVVLQDNFLFTGTIRENITAAKPHAGFDEVVRAAQLAGAEEFIDRLPRGYETHIFEGSPNLSGGQRQRLAIARALIVDPRILILDEATSALDPDSEAIVNENIRRIAQGRTVIVISHRLSSLVNSDAILVLERGKFVDMGKHHELLERCEIYTGLWNQQNRHIAAASRSLATRGPARVS
jgi:ATP-binding cassette subfamily B protein